MGLSIVVALWSRVRLCEFVWTPVTMSYSLREELEKSRFRLEPYASLLPADSTSVRLARRAQSPSTLSFVRSVGCLMFSSTDLKVSSWSGVSSNTSSTSVSWLNLSSIVPEELSNVCAPDSVSSLINWKNTRGCWNIKFSRGPIYIEGMIKRIVKMYKSTLLLIVTMEGWKLSFEGFDVFSLTFYLVLIRLVAPSQMRLNCGRN